MAYIAKLYSSECAVQSVYDAMRLAGVSSNAIDIPSKRLMDDALRMRLFDGGNVDIRRRQLQASMEDAE